MSVAKIVSVDNFLFDLDGCIWFGESLAPGAAELVEFLRASGKRVCFATNISSQLPEAIAAKLTSLGIATGAEDILSPLRVLPWHPAFYDRSRPGVAESRVENGSPSGDVPERGALRSVARAYVIAGDAVREMLTEAGIIVVDRPEEASAVVVGRSPEFGYDDITRSMAATDAKAELLALNLDMRAPGPDGTFTLPGTGVIAAALAAAGGVVPQLVGKPSPFFFETGLRLFGFSRSNTAMVGDSIDSDIMGGSRAGLLTVLVGGGLRARANEADELVEPDFAVADMTSLRELLASAYAPADAT